MVLRIALIVSLLAFPAAVAEGGPKDEPWTGEWRSSFSLLKLKQEGDQVTGTYGDNDQYKIEGTVAGDICTYTYDEGRIVGKGEWVMQESGHAFKGKLIMANGRPRDWHGWRMDPAAEKGKGKYKGMWLTSLGLMQLEHKGNRVKGTFGRAGACPIEGQVKGRRLEFDYQVFRGGSGWFDMDKKNKAFAGAASDHGAHGWWGWEGRAAPEYVHHVKLKAGEIVGGATDNMLSYRVRAPDGYKPGDKKKWPCVVILHGSNMNSQAYVNTLASTWKDIAKEYIILGINGERPSYLGKPQPKGGKLEKGSFPSFNYTYVNWMGRSTYKGYPNTDKESPSLVADALKDLKETYGISRYFVGGHSQGGYLTYVLLMHFPELIAGAFPIAGGVIIQAEPDVFEDEELLARQRDTPLAIVHSKSDPVVSWSASQYANERFQEEGWRAYTFVAPEQGGHMFGLLPIGSTIRWLETMAGDDPATLQDYVAGRMRAKAWPDAGSALHRLRAVEGRGLSARTKELSAQFDDAAGEDAAKYEALIRKNEDGTWIDGFLAFRDAFQHAPCAAGAMAAFGKLRDEHRGPAKAAVQSAREAFQRRDQDGAYGKYQEVVDEHYAAPQYRMVKRWISERK